MILLSFVAFFLAMDPLVPLWLLVLLRAAEPPQRTLDVLEVFSGRGHLWQACSDSGLSARGFDNRQAWEEDVTLFDGFMLLLLLVLSVKEGGLIWLAPPCSWWVFLSHHNHQRTAANQWAGKVEDPKVQRANHIAAATSAVVRLAMSRQVQVVIEQPADSCMFNFPEMAKAARALPFRGIRTYLRSFDPSFPCPKPIQLWGSCHWLKHLRRNKPFDNTVAQNTYQVTADGHVSGGSGLADTATYPRAFGEAVATLAASSSCHATYVLTKR